MHVALSPRRGSAAQRKCFDALLGAQHVQFAWPLVFVQQAQRASRPVVNLLVNRSDPNNGFGVAVLALGRLKC